MWREADKIIISAVDSAKYRQLKLLDVSSGNGVDKVT